MTERALRVALLVALSAEARAAAPPRPPPTPQLESANLQDRAPEDWARALRGSDKAERRLAARELLRQVRAVDRSYHRASPGSLAAMEARQEAVHLREVVTRPCLISLEHPEVAAACAEMLGLLGVEDAVEPLTALAESPPSRRAGRAAARALTLLEVPPP